MVTIVSEQHDLNAINWVRGMSDPGEMISCGYLPELRRLGNEDDIAYRNRITPLIMALPATEREKITKVGIAAAIKRAGYDTSNGRVNVMVAGQPAWAELGVNIAEACGTDDAYNLSGLNYNIVQRKLVAFASGTPDVDIPDKVANFRSDTGAYVATVGKNWTPLQNIELFRFLDQVSKTGAAKWETAGALDGGRRVWGLALLPNMFDVVPGDTVKPYALICNGHDGSLAITIGATGVRVVCANTQRQALSDSKSGFLKIRHSKGSLKGKIEEARRKLGMAAEAMDVYAEEAKALAKVQMGSNQVKEYFTEFFPVEVKPKLEGVNGAQVLDAILTAKGTEKEVMAELLSGHYAETERIAKRNSKILDQLLENFEDKTNTIPGMAGTAWAALNSVSEYVDHQKEYRSADSRLSNVWFGSGDQLKQEAFASAKALANA